MKLTPVMERFVVHWGEMGSRWGVNRSVAQIQGLLYLAQAPMPADEIAETLDIARSNVSNSLRELQSWNLIELSHVLGDRRDHFVAKTDTWEILLTIVEQRKRREIDPILALLRQCAEQADGEAETPAAVRERIKTMAAFVGSLTRWYDQIKTISPATLRRLMKLGAGIAKLVGK